MRYNFNKLFIYLLAVTLTLLLMLGCGEKAREKNTLTIAHQYGACYLPIYVMQEQKLLEQAVGSKVVVKYLLLASGSAINEAVIAGNVDIACIGSPPFFIGLEKGVPYKIAANSGAQPIGLNVNNPEVRTLADLKPNSKIAAPSPGSIQHIVLCMAAEKELGDPKALDSMIIAMAHPEAAQALISGTIDGHLASTPLIFSELNYENIHALPSVLTAVPAGTSIAVSAVTEKLYKDHRELYDAFVKAIKHATDFINSNPSEAAAILAKHTGEDQANVEEYLQHERSVFSYIPQGVEDVGVFMARINLLKSAPTPEQIYHEDLLQAIKSK